MLNNTSSFFQGSSSSSSSDVEDIKKLVEEESHCFQDIYNVARKFRANVAESMNCENAFASYDLKPQDEKVEVISTTKGI